MGLLFLPYTGMVLSYTVIGSMLADTIFWDRVAAIVLIYFLALGIGAHALDAFGSKGSKPWGAAFSKKTLLAMALCSLVLAYTIGIYYMLFYTPLLWGIAILEGFFLLAYNLEWFGGHFHTDGWFVFSWGVLPVLAGYVLQTNQISLTALIFAIAVGLLSQVEISASRPYKEIKRHVLPSEEMIALMARYECILKSVSLGTILLGIGMLAWRWGD